MPAFSKDVQLIPEQWLICLTIVNKLLVHDFDGIPFVFLLLLSYDLTFHYFFEIAAITVLINMGPTLQDLGTDSNGTKGTITQDIGVFVAYLVVIINLLNKLQFLYFSRCLFLINESLWLIVFQIHRPWWQPNHAIFHAVLNIEEFTIAFVVKWAVGDAREVVVFHLAGTFWPILFFARKFD